MKSRLILKDIMRNKVVTLTILTFIAISAMLLSLTSILAIHLFGSIDTLMQTAKTPHFMQMHSGTVDKDKLEEFADTTEIVDEFQVFPFLGIESEKIVVEGKSLVGTLQDNGFCTQSKAFDFLLDLEGNLVSPQEGELYAPVFYSKDGVIKQGDTIEINGVSFTVAGFVRDSQMNSALAYSKRFVISEIDYTKLEPFGAVESLIEFRLNDIEKIGSFEAAYSAAGLPANGPVLTWSLFRMLSAISDGMMIAVVLLISILVILIALFCIRFTLLAKIEEDYKEIGTMKAIGMRLSDIKSIYLATYGALAAVGCLLGFALSLLFYAPLLSGIRLNFGDSKNSSTAFLCGILGVILLFGLILFYVNINLRRFRSISAAEAIRFGISEKAGRTGMLSLAKNKFLSTNFFLGISDVLARKRLYGTLLVVVMLGAFIIIVPQNLYHTISSENFVTYMGVGRCDLRVDIQQNGDIVDKTKQVEDYVMSDEEVSDFTVLTTKTFGTKLKDGTTENIKVEFGDHKVFPVAYAEGRMPQSEQEIALSSLNAEEWGKRVGDTITLLTTDGEKTLTVCGIYSDITNGGKTAKAVFSDEGVDAAWSIVCVGFSDSTKKSAKLTQYQKQFDFARVSSIDDYISQTFGQTLRSVRTASFVAVCVAIAVILLVSLLFLKLLMAKDAYSIAVIKAIGYTNADLKWQFTWRILSVLTVGIILGTILAGTLGEQIAAMAISSFGAAAFRFVVNVPATYLLCPLVLLLTTMIAVAVGTKKIGQISIATSMKE